MACLLISQAASNLERTRGFVFVYRWEDR
jgi:hypothetical protein